MAQNIIINGVTYNGTPAVTVPLAAGGGNATFYDTADATATAMSLMYGVKAYGASGAITGQLTVPTVTQDSTTHIVSIS